jgi:hypothetical protein
VLDHVDAIDEVQSVGFETKVFGSAEGQFHAVWESFRPVEHGLVNSLQVDAEPSETAKKEASSETELKSGLRRIGCHSPEAAGHAPEGDRDSHPVQETRVVQSGLLFRGRNEEPACKMTAAETLAETLSLAPGK